MPLKAYGVLKGKAIEVRLGAGNSPHYQVRLVDDDTDYRIAINVKSQLSPSEVEYVILENFHHPVTERVAEYDLGFTQLEKKPGTGALDYIRGNLFERSLMKPLPFNVPGFDNDLNEKLDRIMQRAVADEDAIVCAFGERWGPEPGKKDKFFGFLPGNGIHDIHMNQSNVGKYVEQDGVWQDGGILVSFSSGEWVGIFLKFQSQGWHTDDVTGHKIGADTTPAAVPPGAVPQPAVVPPVFLPTHDEPQGLVRIVAALINSETSPETETVTLLNTAPHGVSLDGWRILNTREESLPLDGAIAGGQARTIVMPKEVPLSNKGGLISLVNEAGLKVDGVSYTKAQASQPGWTIVF
jgi:uncharacterized protein YukJ